MMNFFRIAQILATAIPVIHQLVQVAEVTIPGAKQGAQKLEAVISMVTPVLGAIGATPADSAQLSPLVRSVIAGIVAAGNSARSSQASSSS